MPEYIILRPDRGHASEYLYDTYHARILFLRASNGRASNGGGGQKRPKRISVGSVLSCGCSVYIQSALFPASDWNHVRAKPVPCTGVYCIPSSGSWNLMCFTSDRLPREHEWDRWHNGFPHVMAHSFGTNFSGETR